MPEVLHTAEGSGGDNVHMALGPTQADDVLVALWLTHTTDPPTIPTAVSGCGATWSQVFATDRVGVWIGEAPTAAGPITFTGGSGFNNYAGFHVRGVDASHVDASMGAYGGLVTEAETVTVGVTQVILGLAGLHTVFPSATTLPSPGDYTVNTNRAWALPDTPTPHRLAAAYTDVGTVRPVLVQVVLGTLQPDLMTIPVIVEGEDSAVGVLGETVLVEVVNTSIPVEGQTVVDSHVPGPQGPRGDVGDTGPVGPMGPSGLVVVEHGTNATAPRPSVQLVYWVGTAIPVNARPYDWRTDA